MASQKKENIGENEKVTRELLIKLNGIEILRNVKVLDFKPGTMFYLNVDLGLSESSVYGPWPLDKDGFPLTLVLDLRPGIDVSSTIRAIND